MKKILITLFYTSLMALAFSSIAQPGNPATITESVRIHADETSGCAPLKVAFGADLGGVGVTYHWDFGNGTTSTVANPLYSYEQPGTFKVVLEAQYNNKLYVDSLTIEVFEIPDGTIEASTTSPCIDAPVSFSLNTIANTNEYFWNFGNGDVSSELNPEYAYPSSGAMDVQLLLGNEKGCYNILTKEIEVIKAPIYNVGVSSYTSCGINDPLKFEVLSKASVECHWVCGDGDSIIQNPVIHTYKTAGTYSPHVFITDDKGCEYKEVVEKDIVVKDLSLLDFTVSDSSICETSELYFSTPDQNYERIEWRIDNAIIATDVLGDTITLSDHGPHDITLNVTDNDHCTNSITKHNVVEVFPMPRADFTITDTSGCSPLAPGITNNSSGATRFEWNFGDGMVSTLSSPTHTYVTAGDFNISLKAINDFGCSATKQLGPIHVFTVDFDLMIGDSIGCIPFTPNLEITSDHDLVEYNWYLNQKLVATDATPQINLTTPDSLDLKVVVKDNDGCSGQASYNNILIALDAELPFDTPVDIISCKEEIVVTCNGKDIGNDNWYWDFGDGATSEEESPTHMYTEPGEYIISLRSNNKYGCASSIPVYNRVLLSYPIGSFTTEMDCNSATVELEADYDDSLYTASWDFGDGNTGIGTNISHTYAMKGQYDVSLTLEDSLGCSNTIVNFNAVSPEPCDSLLGPVIGVITKAPFEITEDGESLLACLPFEITFSSPVIGDFDYFWDFGDGATSTEKYPSHIYTTPGNFDVTLTLTKSDGQSAQVKSDFTIRLQAPIERQINESVIGVCGGFHVQYSSELKGLREWEWTLPDGFKTDSIEPSQGYPKAGNYIVSLRGVDNYGCARNHFKNMHLFLKEQEFEFQDVVCENDSFQLHHTIQNYNSFLWDFGNGDSSTSEFPYYAFDSAGFYNVSVTAGIQEGCLNLKTLSGVVEVRGVKAEIETIGDTQGCDSIEVKFINKTPASTYNWSFGNQMSSTEANPTRVFHSGVYDIGLTVSDGMCYDTTTLPAHIQVGSVSALFTYSVTKECAPATASFIPEEPETKGHSYSWSFGDGDSSFVYAPVHLYEQDPEDKIKLVVMDTLGCKDTKAYRNNQFIEAKFMLKESAGCIPFETQFKNQSKHYTDLFWDFGNGTNSTERMPIAEYNTEGVFPVTLIASGASGCTDTLHLDSLVDVRHLQAGYELQSVTEGCTPLVAKFNNKSEGASDVHWDFGDGTHSTTSNATHIYSKPGFYNPFIKVTNDIGCIDSILFSETIHVKGPDINFEASTYSFCHPDTVAFTDLSAQAVHWEWLFGNGDTSMAQHPTYFYSTPGNYKVTLFAADQYGCTEQMTKNIEVKTPPQFSFALNEYEGCVPYAISSMSNLTDVDNPTFNWLLNGNSISTQQNMAYQINTPGEYNLQLSVQNANGCEVIKTAPNSIRVYDSNIRNEPVVKQVTVIHNEDNLIRWELETSPNFNYHLIYRQDHATDPYALLDTIWDQDITFFRDSNVDVMRQAYQYKLQTIGKCPIPLSLDELNTYVTIHSVITAHSDHILVDWSDFSGLPFDKYLVYRKKKLEQDFVAIGETPPHQTSFRDKEHLCPEEYDYMIVASNNGNAETYSFSNTVTEQPLKNYIKNQSVDIIRSTVINNNVVFTEWTSPDTAYDKVEHYVLYRSKDHEEYVLVDSIPRGVNIFLDDQVDINAHAYTYKISVDNSCDIITPESNMGSSILLTKNTDGYINVLKWTPYREWETGVKKYLIQRKNEYDEWETVGESNGGIHETVIDLER